MDPNKTNQEMQSPRQAPEKKTQTHCCLWLICCSNANQAGPTACCMDCDNDCCDNICGNSCGCDSCNYNCCDDNCCDGN